MFFGTKTKYKTNDKYIKSNTKKNIKVLNEIHQHAEYGFNTDFAHNTNKRSSVLDMKRTWKSFKYTTIWSTLMLSPIPVQGLIQKMCSQCIFSSFYYQIDKCHTLTHTYTISLCSILKTCFYLQHCIGTCGIDNFAECICTQKGRELEGGERSQRSRMNGLDGVWRLSSGFSDALCGHIYSGSYLDAVRGHFY